VKDFAKAWAKVMNLDRLDLVYSKAPLAITADSHIGRLIALDLRTARTGVRAALSPGGAKLYGATVNLVLQFSYVDKSRQAAALSPKARRFEARN
jgi:hypothetical protein